MCRKDHMPAQPGSTGAPMARRILSLLLALLGGCDCTCSTGKGLRGWLCAAHVDLEELDIQDVGGFNLKISSIQCSGFEVGMLRSGTSAAVPASTGRSNASLTVDVDAFSFNCTIERLDAKQTSFPYLEPVGSGRLVVRGAKLDAGLVTQMAGPVPLSINVSASTQLRVDASQVELSLSGNVWMKLINAIKPLLISTVIEMLPSIVKDVRHAPASLRPTPPLPAHLAPYALIHNPRGLRSQPGPGLPLLKPDLPATAFTSAQCRRRLGRCLRALMLMSADSCTCLPPSSLPPSTPAAPRH